MLIYLKAKKQHITPLKLTNNLVQEQTPLLCKYAVKQHVTIFRKKIHCQLRLAVSLWLWPKYVMNILPVSEAGNRQPVAHSTRAAGVKSLSGGAAVEVVGVRQVSQWGKQRTTTKPPPPFPSPIPSAFSSSQNNHHQQDQEVM